MLMETRHEIHHCKFGPRADWHDAFYLYGTEYYYMRVPTAGDFCCDFLGDADQARVLQFLAGQRLFPRC